MKEIISLGHEVHAIAPLGEHDETEQTHLKNQLEQMGVIFYPVQLARTGNSPLGDLSYFYDLKRLISKIKPDRILAYTMKPIVYAGLAARSLKHEQFYPLFSGLGYTFSHTKGIKSSIVRLLAKGLLKRALHKSNAIIFQNPDDEALMRKTGLISPKQVSHVVNGSGVDMHHYPYHKPVTPKKELTFIMIGRILIDKGIREYAQAASILKAKYPDCRFIHVGENDEVSLNSPDPDEFATWTAIEFLGKHDDVRPFLKQSHVFVLPSFYREGVPRSILEAMATGLAIITADRPGCRETVIEGQNGYLVQAKDSKALANAMEKFILEPELCVTMGKASYQIAKEKYDVNLVNADLLKIMQIVPATISRKFG